MQFDTMIDRARAAAGSGMESASDASNATNGLTRRSIIFRPLIVNQDAQRGAIQIVELAAAQRPEKGTKPQKTKPKRNGDEKGNSGHFAAAFSRKALATTITEEPDMASAAIKGVTSPMIAIGTAMIL